LARCAAIKPNGERCKGVAIRGSEWRPAHHPDYAEQRRQRASKGGKRGGRGRPGASRAEITEAKSWIRGLISKTLRGEVERDVATACFMGLNVLARYIELEGKIREQEELVARLEALEAQEERIQNINGRSQTGGRWR
jgi:hypothetical protein